MISAPHQPTLDDTNKLLLALSKKVRTALDQKDYSTAKSLVERVLSIAPKHSTAWCDLAFVEIRLNEYESGYQHAMNALAFSKAPIDPNIYDILTEVCAESKRYEEMRYYGRLAIQSKKQQVADQLLPVATFAQRPQSISPDRRQNIISYSLFGDQARYCEVAVLNAKLAKSIYPEWTCRFYLDDSVPNEIVDRLQDEGAEIIRMDSTNSKFSGLFWRFLVIDDPQVHCFIIRDADSLLSYKERAAVDAWLASDKWFHCMRDSYSHSELILAGMWGGFHGALRNIQQDIDQFLSSKFIANRTIDQQFLRRIIWSQIAHSCLTHDSTSYDVDSAPFPDYQLSEIEKTPGFHIGMIDSCFTTLIHIEDPQAQQVRWLLKDQDLQTICSYVALVPATRKLEVNLPYRYTQHIKDQTWQIFTQTIG